jgi:hypothetical protein
VANNNIVARCGTGIRIYNSARHSGSKAFNNTLVDNGRGIAAREGMSDLGAWNNIIYNSDNLGLVDSNSSFSFCDYNLYHQSEEGCGSHNVVADPQFIDMAFGDPLDFGLEPSSPARGAGRTGENIGAYASGNEVIGVKK